MIKFKKYRVKIIMLEMKWIRFENINQVNEYINNNSKETGLEPCEYYVESWDWEKQEYLPLSFGKVLNKFCNPL